MMKATHDGMFLAGVLWIKVSSLCPLRLRESTQRTQISWFYRPLLLREKFHMDCKSGLRQQLGLSGQPGSRAQQWISGKYFRQTEATSSSSGIKKTFIVKSPIFSFFPARYRTDERFELRKMETPEWSTGDLLILTDWQWKTLTLL